MTTPRLSRPQTSHTDVSPASAYSRSSTSSPRPSFASHRMPPQPTSPVPVAFQTSPTFSTRPLNVSPSQSNASPARFAASGPQAPNTEVSRFSCSTDSHRRRGDANGTCPSPTQTLSSLGGPTSPSLRSTDGVKSPRTSELHRVPSLSGHSKTGSLTSLRSKRISGPVFQVASTGLEPSSTDWEEQRRSSFSSDHHSRHDVTCTNSPANSSHHSIAPSTGTARRRLLSTAYEETTDREDDGSRNGIYANKNDSLCAPLTPSKRLSQEEEGRLKSKFSQSPAPRTALKAALSRGAPWAQSESHIPGCGNGALSASAPNRGGGPIKLDFLRKSCDDRRRPSISDLQRCESPALSVKGRSRKVLQLLNINNGSNPAVVAPDGAQSPVGTPAACEIQVATQRLQSMSFDLSRSKEESFPSRGIRHSLRQSAARLRPRFGSKPPEYSGPKMSRGPIGPDGDVPPMPNFGEHNPFDPFPEIAAHAGAKRKLEPANEQPNGPQHSRALHHSRELTLADLGLPEAASEVQAHPPASFIFRESVNPPPTEAHSKGMRPLRLLNRSSPRKPISRPSFGALRSRSSKPPVSGSTAPRAHQSQNGSTSGIRDSWIDLSEDVHFDGQSAVNGPDGKKRGREGRTKVGWYRNLARRAPIMQTQQNGHAQVEEQDGLDSFGREVVQQQEARKVGDHARMLSFETPYPVVLPSLRTDSPLVSPLMPQETPLSTSLSLDLDRRVPSSKPMFLPNLQTEAVRKRSNHTRKQSALINLPLRQFSADTISSKAPSRPTSPPDEPLPVLPGQHDWSQRRDQMPSLRSQASLQSPKTQLEAAMPVSSPPHSPVVASPTVILSPTPLPKAGDSLPIPPRRISRARSSTIISNASGASSPREPSSSSSPTTATAKKPPPQHISVDTVGTSILFPDVDLAVTRSGGGRSRRNLSAGSSLVGKTSTRMNTPKTSASPADNDISREKRTPRAEDIEPIPPTPIIKSPLAPAHASTLDIEPAPKSGPVLESEEVKLAKLLAKYICADSASASGPRLDSKKLLDVLVREEKRASGAVGQQNVGDVSAITQATEVLNDLVRQFDPTPGGTPRQAGDHTKVQRTNSLLLTPEHRQGLHHPASAAAAVKLTPERWRKEEDQRRSNATLTNSVLSYSSTPSSSTEDLTSLLEKMMETDEGEATGHDVPVPTASTPMAPATVTRERATANDRVQTFHSINSRKRKESSDIFAPTHKHPSMSPIPEAAGSIDLGRPLSPRVLQESFDRESVNDIVDLYSRRERGSSEHSRSLSSNKGKRKVLGEVTPSLNGAGDPTDVGRTSTTPLHTPPLIHRSARQAKESSGPDSSPCPSTRKLRSGKSYVRCGPGNVGVAPRRIGSAIGSARTSPGRGPPRSSPLRQNRGPGARKAWLRSRNRVDSQSSMSVHTSARPSIEPASGSTDPGTGSTVVRRVHVPSPARLGRDVFVDMMQGTPCGMGSNKAKYPSVRRKLFESSPDKYEAGYDRLRLVGGLLTPTSSPGTSRHEYDDGGKQAFWSALEHGSLASKETTGSMTALQNQWKLAFPTPPDDTKSQGRRTPTTMTLDCLGGYRSAGADTGEEGDTETESEAEDQQDEQRRQAEMEREEADESSASFLSMIPCLIVTGTDGEEGQGEGDGGHASE